MEGEMKTKTNITKSLSVTLLLILASVATTGLVLASHDSPNYVFRQGSVAELNQYERYYQTHMAFTLSETDSFEGLSTRRQMELNEEALSNLTMNMVNERRLKALSEGYSARLQFELERREVNERRLAALSEGYSARLQLELERSAAFAKSLAGSSYGHWFLIEHFTDFGR
jgi:hypothetical protein